MGSSDIVVYPIGRLEYYPTLDFQIILAGNENLSREIFCVTTST